MPRAFGFWDTYHWEILGLGGSLENVCWCFLIWWFHFFAKWRPESALKLSKFTRGYEWLRLLFHLLHLSPQHGAIQSTSRPSLHAVGRRPRDDVGWELWTLRLGERRCRYAKVSIITLHWHITTKVLTDIIEVLLEVGYDMIMTCHLPAVKWVNLKQLGWSITSDSCTGFPMLPFGRWTHLDIFFNWVATKTPNLVMLS